MPMQSSTKKVPGWAMSWKLLVMLMLFAFVIPLLCCVRGDTSVGVSPNAHMQDLDSHGNQGWSLDVLNKGVGGHFQISGETDPFGFGLVTDPSRHLLMRTLSQSTYSYYGSRGGYGRGYRYGRFRRGRRYGRRGYYGRYGRGYGRYGRSYGGYYGRGRYGYRD